ncbi:MAG: hypothetical protein J6A51_04395 [Clostridia bacterium]|nr:hypothetical protein [Clostridia bacterium]
MKSLRLKIAIVMPGISISISPSDVLNVGTTTSIIKTKIPSVITKSIMG